MLFERENSFLYPYSALGSVAGRDFFEHEIFTKNYKTLLPLLYKAQFGILDTIYHTK